MAVIDLNQAIMSFTEMFKNLNQQSVEMVGIVVQWMRAVPHENSEDVIFHEYTLHDVECPKDIKVITTNTNYNPGNFSIDYFGINYESPLELSIDIQTWENVFGTDSMPQQHDVVYVGKMNCLYEVASSTIDYGFANQETGYKIQLTKWNPRANVRLNQGVEDTINNLTESEQELFGEEISKDIADIVDDEEISQMLNTSVDSHDIFKSVDIDSVFEEDIDTNNNTVARSYYDMRYSKQSIFYKTGDSVDIVSKKPHRYFSCWFKIIPQGTQTYKIGNLLNEEGKYYLIGTNIKEGTEIILKRGALLQLHGTTHKVASINGEERLMVTFNNSEFKALTKKITNWNNNLTMSVAGANNIHPLLMGRYKGECNFNISIVDNSVVIIKFGNSYKKISINELPLNQWCSIGINLGKESNVCVFTMNDKKVLGLSQMIELGDMENVFDVGEFYITESNTQLTNIRYYQTTKKVEVNAIEKDLNSQLMQNNSDAIIADIAAVSNKSPYIAEQR